MKFFISFVLVGWIGFGIAQTIQLVDSKTSSPVSSVTLLSNSPKAFAVSNENGEVNINDFVGAEQIEIRSLGYVTIVKSYNEVNKPPFKIELEPNNLKLDEVVISSSKWKQNSGNLPSKVIRIDPEDIAIQNPQTAADLLGVSGSVFIQKSQQGGGSPMIRGFATNRLLYTVDGVRMNTAIFRSGNIQNVISLDPFAIENTEVYFGPGSPIYGSDAIGGVMSFQTLTPQLSDHEEPLIQAKTVSRFSTANNEKTGHIDLNIGWKKWASVSSISFNDFGHLKQGKNGSEDYLKPFFVVRENNTDSIIEQKDKLLQVPSAYDQLNLMQKIRFKPNKTLDFQYGFHYSKTSRYGRYDRHNRSSNGNPAFGRWDYGPQKWMMNHLNTTISNPTKVYNQLIIRLAHQFFEEGRISRGFNELDEKTQIEEVNALSFNLDFNKILHNRTTLFYGIEAIHNDVESIGFSKNLSTTLISPSESRYPQSDWSTYAAYVNAMHTLTDRLSFHAGLRYSIYNIIADFDTSLFSLPFTKAELNNGALTASLGATYRPNETIVFKSKASTGFRAPNIDDLGKVFDSEPGAVTVPNPNLDAEFAYNIDLGVAKIFGNFLKVDFTAFYTRLEKAMVRRSFQLNGADSIVFNGILSQVQAIQNAAFAEVYGFQTGIELKLPHRITFSSDINIQKGEEELDNGQKSSSRHASPIFGTTSLKFVVKPITLLISLNYQDEVKHRDLAVSEQAKTDIYALDANGNTYAPSWYALNLKTIASFSRRITASFGVENITDQRYRPYSSGISAPSRNFVVSFMVKLNP